MLQLVKGRDGQVRGARLRVLSKAGKRSPVHRPVQRLIRFGIQEKSVVNDEEIQRKLRFRAPLAVHGLEERQQLKDRLCAEFANNIHSNYSKEQLNYLKL